MFVFILITAELALVYTAFWYLFLREPRYRERIRASMWGSYEGGADCGEHSLPLRQKCFCTSSDPVHQLAVAHADEFVFDTRSNHYVPVNNSGSVLVQLASSIDRTLSQLNVRP